MIEININDAETGESLDLFVAEVAAIPGFPWRDYRVYEGHPLSERRKQPIAFVNNHHPGRGIADLAHRALMEYQIAVGKTTLRG